MDKLVNYAMRFVGVPYVWKGNNPLTGWDCSAFCAEVGRFGGVIPHSLDMSAQMISDYFLDHGGQMNVWGAGSFSFYGRSWKEVTHIGFCVDQYRMLECGGGDSTTTSVSQAALRNAFVRGRLIKYRDKDFLGVIRPKYTAIGIAF